MKITKLTDIKEDLLIIEVGDDADGAVFYLCYHEKTGVMTINLSSGNRIIEFEIDEFQKLIEKLKTELKDWAVSVADKN